MNLVVGKNGVLQKMQQSVVKPLYEEQINYNYSPQYNQNLPHYNPLPQYTKNQEQYWKILDENQITLCFGPAGVGKSYIAMKKAVDLLYDDNNKYEKIIIILICYVQFSERSGITHDGCRYFL